MSQDPVQAWASKWAFVYEHAPRILTNPSIGSAQRAIELAEYLFDEIERRREASKPEGAG